MIYTLEVNFGDGIYVQLNEILHKAGIKFETLVYDVGNELHSVSIDNNIFDFVQSKVTKNDTLIIESSYFFSSTKSDFDFSKLDSLPCKTFVLHSESRFIDKSNVFGPHYDLDNIVKNSPNFYLLNFGLSKHRWLIHTLFERYRNMYRDKMFYCTNGVFKGHRTLLYSLLKENNILDSTYYSYQAYSNLDDDYETHFKNIDIKNPITEKYFESLKKELPVVLDYEWHGKVDQASITLPYTTNSYISLVCCTFYDETKEIYTSEKVFKPFFSFHIPIFFGARGLYRVPKKLGFYLFDDLIDLSFDNIQDNGERFYMAFDQIYHIKRMGKKELHNYYSRKHNELLHNFNLLKKLSDSQLENLNKLIYDNK